LNLTWLLGPRQPPVQIELCIVVGDVLVGQMRRRVERDVGWCELVFAPRSLLPLLQPSHRFFEPPQVHVEPYGLHVARLLPAEQIPGSAQLQIA